MKRRVWIALLICAFTAVFNTSAADKKGEKVPERTQDILSQLQNNVAELRSSVSAKKQKPIHDHAVAIKRLASELPNRASSGSKKEVTAAANDLKQAADATHESAHDEKWAEAKKQADRADEALKRLEREFKPAR